jgi:hypothetical protein
MWPVNSLNPNLLPARFNPVDLQREPENDHSTHDQGIRRVIQATSLLDYVSCCK